MTGWAIVPCVPCWSSATARVSNFPPPTLKSAQDLSAHDDWLPSSLNVDSFCSSSTWGVSANYAFGDAGQVVHHQSESGSALFVWNTLFLRPLESVWLLGSPLLGPSPSGLFRELRDDDSGRIPPWHAMILSGITMETPQWRELHCAITEDCALRWISSRNRNIASLQGGSDGFLSRRSPKFRTNLRRSVRRAADSGFEFKQYTLTTATDARVFFGILRDIEERSHKATTGNGILEEPMHSFVASVFGLTIERHGLRFIIAWRDGLPAGYIFGTVFMNMYRGLQMKTKSPCTTWAPTSPTKSAGQNFVTRRRRWPSFDSEHA